MRPRSRKIVLFSLLAGVFALVFFDPMGQKNAGAPSSPVSLRSGGPAETAGHEAGARTGSDGSSLALPGQRGLSEADAELFGSRSWQPPLPKVVAVPATPTAPPLPYKFAGKLVQEGRLQMFLSKGDTAIPIKQGEILDGSYRVESIADDRITLVYIPLNYRENIPVSSALQSTGGTAPVAAAAALATASVIAATPAAPRRDVPVVMNASGMKADARPAQLLWHGPQQVKLGTRFSVALHVTSEQPVRASPMQFKFDPGMLETVAVKPGRFFGQSDRNFSYRINSNGTIFVGASNPGPLSAADAELLVLTFRPLKPASAAELSIASLNLQDAAGQPIAFDQLTPFKTVITP
ncbi:MAG: cohesin domain-containing protein [Burkholderiales bacterium]